MTTIKQLKSLAEKAKPAFERLQAIKRADEQWPSCEADSVLALADLGRELSDPSVVMNLLEIIELACHMRDWLPSGDHKTAVRSIQDNYDDAIRKFYH